MFASVEFPIAIAVWLWILGVILRTRRALSPALQPGCCCAHPFPSWINTLLYSTFTTLSQLLLSLTPSPPSTPFSIWCGTMITTLLLNLQKITSWPTFLLYLPPMTLQPPPAPQKTLRTQAANGLKMKSTSSLTSSKQIAFWWPHEASTWKNRNLTKLGPQ